MADLSQLANIAEIVGAIIVVGGLFFAVIQMRQIRQQRREMAAIELFRFFGSPQFSHAYQRVLGLPDGLDRKALEDYEEDIEQCAMIISTTMENIGVMVYHRIVPSLVVSHLIGTSTVILWRKLSNWIADIRTEMDNPAAFEWFQWLAEALAKMEANNQPPAYELYADWKPGRAGQGI